MRRFWRIAPWLVTIFLAGAYISARRVAERESVTSKMMQLIGAHYIRPIPRAQLESASVRDMVARLGDPYASVFTPGDRADLDRVVSAAYGGVGVEVHSVGPDAVVDEVFAGSPAADANISRGDTLHVVSGAIEGEDGGTVGIQVQNGNSRRVLLTRRSVHVPSVVEASCADGVGYVRLFRIGHGAGGEVRQVVGNIEHCATRGWILDLRGDRGGEMVEAMNVLGAFIGPNKVGALVHERQDTEQYVSSGDSVVNGAVAVLIDSQTASAAEVLAGALRDWRRGYLMGTRTWGKGVVQTIYNVSGGYAVKLTTGTWTTPLGLYVGTRGGERGMLPDSIVADSVIIGVAGEWIRGHSL